MNKILAILDDRAGNNSQVIGVSNILAQKLKSEVINFTAKYNNLAKLPNLSFILPGYYNLSEQPSFDIIQPSSKLGLVVSAGRKAAVIASIYKKQNPGTKWIQIMWPGVISGLSADLIILPEHDSSHIFYTNKTIRMIGAPHKITKEILEQNKDENFVQSNGKKKVGVLIGGSHKSGTFTFNDAKNFVDNLKEYAKDKFLMVSTSRRSGEEITNYIVNQLQHDHYVYDYRKQGENPYFKILANSDELIVTGDSVSMLSEALATQKPIYIYYNSTLCGKKHLAMIDKLITNSYAYNFLTALPTGTKFSKIDTMEYLMTEIMNKIITKN